MKEKIIYLVIGILIGAIITTIGFYFYNKNHKMQNPRVEDEKFQMMQENREFGPKGNRNKGGFTNETESPTLDGEVPPEKPDAAGADGQEQIVPPELNKQSTTEAQNITSTSKSTNNES